MITQIVGMQQIVITVVFLSCLIGLLLFLRMKGGFIRANLQRVQRIHVVEETLLVLLTTAPHYSINMNLLCSLARDFSLHSYRSH